MKTAIVLMLLLALFALPVMAQLDEVPFPTISTCWTGTVAKAVTNSSWITGYLVGLTFDFSGWASPTCDIAVVIYGKGGMSGTVVLTNQLLADGVYFPVRYTEQPGLTTNVLATSWYDKYPLIVQKLIIRHCNSPTNSTLNATAIIDRR